MQTWQRLTLITMTVGGGFAGLALTLQSLLVPQNRELPNLEAVASFFALYAYVTGSGLVFVCYPERTRPLTIALAAQIPRLSSPLFVYRFCAGAEAFVDVKIAPPGLRLEFQTFFGSRGQFGMLGQAPWSLGVNIFALVALILLWRSVRTLNPAPVELRSATSQPEAAQATNPAATVIDPPPAAQRRADQGP